MKKSLNLFLDILRLFKFIVVSWLSAIYTTYLKFIFLQIWTLLVILRSISFFNIISILKINFRRFECGSQLMAIKAEIFKETGHDLGHGHDPFFRIGSWPNTVMTNLGHDRFGSWPKKIIGSWPKSVMTRAWVSDPGHWPTTLSFS